LAESKSLTFAGSISSMRQPVSTIVNTRARIHQWRKRLGPDPDVLADAAWSCVRMIRRSNRVVRLNDPHTFAASGTRGAM
jgi:hypothetical protein